MTKDVAEKLANAIKMDFGNATVIEHGEGFGVYTIEGFGRILRAVIKNSNVFDGVNVPMFNHIEEGRFITLF